MEALENELKDTIAAKKTLMMKKILCGDSEQAQAVMRAALFAAELFRMYTHYAESKRWKIEVVNADETGIGGMKRN